MFTTNLYSRNSVKDSWICRSWIRLIVKLDETKHFVWLFFNYFHVFFLFHSRVAQQTRRGRRRSSPVHVERVPPVALLPQVIRSAGSVAAHQEPPGNRAVCRSVTQQTLIHLFIFWMQSVDSLAVERQTNRAVSKSQSGELPISQLVSSSAKFKF